MADTWDEARVQTYVTDKTPESPFLDYKASPALERADNKMTEISKDVSSFANSGGGAIIYGVEQESNSQGVPIPKRIDDGIDPTVISPEWLEQVINSRVHQRIQGLRIHQVRLQSNQPLRVLYVVEIPEAITFAPHMAGDNKYYKRGNFRAVPMEEYEVRWAFQRRNVPDLRAELTLIDPFGVSVATQSGDYPSPIDLCFKLFNDGEEPATVGIAKLYIDSGLDIAEDGGASTITLNQGFRYKLNDKETIRLGSELVFKWSPADNMPIFNMPDGWRLGTSDLRVKIQRERLDAFMAYPVAMQIYVPHMEVKHQQWYLYQKNRLMNIS